MQDLYYVCYQAIPSEVKGLPDDVCGAIVRGYLNASDENDAVERIKKRIVDLGWKIEFLEVIELFQMDQFDSEEHQAIVVQKAMEGKVAVDIEYWCACDVMWVFFALYEI